MPTGTTPRAKRSSWSLTPREMTRCGSRGTSVSPNLWATTIGPRSSTASGVSLDDAERSTTFEGASIASAAEAVGGGDSATEVPPLSALQAPATEARYRTTIRLGERNSLTRYLLGFCQRRGRKPSSPLNSPCPPPRPDLSFVATASFDVHEDIPTRSDNRRS